MLEEPCRLDGEVRPFVELVLDPVYHWKFKGKTLAEAMEMAKPTYGLHLKATSGPDGDPDFVMKAIDNELIADIEGYLREFRAARFTN